MKIKINQFEIDIKAKDTLINDKYNQKDTEAFLTLLATAYQNAYIHLKGNGYDSTAEYYQSASNQLFNYFLDKAKAENI